ncbi:MAG: MFS transporter [Verrucomicrobia bacterium]|nr:MAG: MFS transporter [Verrucomicrobiota bacterium]PYK28314.1 MAG: MFS transporter [Verrucomicrobiota bacterium]PYK51390.1 MAG: MFS transporter [Verrucomicrobiota bacterium]
MEPVVKKPMSGARSALFLLLAINLFNYIDRQILAALEPDIRANFFAASDVNAMTKTGLLGDAFFVTYMLSAPILGLLADRFSRWIIVGSAVILWSLASGGSGLAATFAILFVTRVCVGIGEGGYGPAAPTILSDLFPIETRGRIMAIFCAAIPVGSALGYVIGGLIGAHLGWRWAFYLVAPPGLLLGLLCFRQRDPRADARHLSQKSPRRSISDYLNLFRTRSYLINCIAMTLMTFVTGGLGFWVPAYLRYRNQSPAVGMTIFGLITVVAGLVSTLLGGVIADRLRSRFAGSYFWVSGIGMLIACPFFVATLYTPFPAAWLPMFFAIFFLFVNTGPSNTALANVALPAVRATAFAVNILVIHALGDVQAFWLLGYIGGHTNMHVAFLFVSGIIFLSGLTWLIGVKYLPADTAAVESQTAE